MARLFSLLFWFVVRNESAYHVRFDCMSTVSNRRKLSDAECVLSCIANCRDGYRYDEGDSNLIGDCLDGVGASCVLQFSFENFLSLDYTGSCLQADAVKVKVPNSPMLARLSSADRRMRSRRMFVALNGQEKCNGSFALCNLVKNEDIQPGCVIDENAAGCGYLITANQANQTEAGISHDFNTGVMKPNFGVDTVQFLLTTQDRTWLGRPNCPFTNPDGETALKRILDHSYVMVTETVRMNGGA